MNEEYIYNTIKRILAQRVNNIPNNVPFNELVNEVVGDMKLIINNLVEEKKITYHRDINGGLLFYDKA